MACFLVPLGEAVVASVVKHTLLKQNTKNTVELAQKKAVWKSRISALEQMLYGGCFVLAIEHVYHGEVVFYPPFLTAMRNPEETKVMLNEIATVGSSMAVVVSAIWGIMCLIAAKKSSSGVKKEGKAKLFARMAIGTATMFIVDGIFAALG